MLVRSVGFVPDQIEWNVADSDATEVPQPAWMGSWVHVTPDNNVTKWHISVEYVEIIFGLDDSLFAHCVSLSIPVHFTFWAVKETLDLSEWMEFAMMVSKKRCHAFLTCQILNIEALQQELNKNRKDSPKKKNRETCDVFNNIRLFRICCWEVKKFKDSARVFLDASLKKKCGYDSCVWALTSAPIWRSGLASWHHRLRMTY